MSLEDAGGDRGDVRAVADVADLDVPADLVCEGTEAILSPGDVDAMPTRRRERPRGRFPDARRCSGDDGDTLHSRNVTQTRAGPSRARPESARVVGPAGSALTVATRGTSQ